MKGAIGFIFCAIVVIIIACEKRSEPVYEIEPQDKQMVLSGIESEFSPQAPKDFSFECLYKSKDTKTGANTYFLWITGSTGGSKREALFILDIKGGDMCVGQEMVGRNILSDLGVSLYLSYPSIVADKILEKLKQ
ncbi:MAG: hypothetical protein JXD23_08925 [Spirochaetales bacterium]|nr:hypothetical protein [Spirochaetales bacterium]